MKTTAFLAISLLSVAVVACQKAEQLEPAAQTTTTSTAAPATTAATTSPSSAPYDLQFLDSMSAHHASAVQMASMAKDKIQQPELKKLVSGMPGDQQKEIDQMKAWRDQWYPGASKSDNMAMPGMGGSMRMDMSHMQSMKSGAGYDEMFIDMMTPHHQGAVTMAQEALTKAEHPEIKALAQRIIDAQTKEIATMKKVKADREALTSHSVGRRR